MNKRIQCGCGHPLKQIRRFYLRLIQTNDIRMSSENREVKFNQTLKNDDEFAIYEQEINKVVHICDELFK